MFEMFYFRKKVKFVLFIFLGTGIFSQTTVWQQGFENAAVTCTENWGYTGSVRNTETFRTGSYSGRIGRLGESNTITFNTVDVSNLSGLNLQIYHSVRGGSGPGMDTREGAVISVSLNGAAYTVIARIGGFGDHNYGWSSATGGSGSASSGCTVYQSANALNYTIPGGTNTIAVKIVTVGRNSSTCANFNADMSAGSVTNFDRSDEGLFLDDVKITTTSSFIPGIWTGVTSTDWHDCSNWQNKMVPTSITNVIIAETASNNCEVYQGNAICNTLELKSSTSTNRFLIVRNIRTLQVNSDLQINKTASSGDLELQIYDGGVLNVNANIAINRTGGSGKAILKMEDNGAAGSLTCNNLSLTGVTALDESAVLSHDNLETATVFVNGNLTINAGGCIDMSDGGDINFNSKIYLRGNWNSMSSETDFKQTGSIIVFDGTSNQFINTSGFNEVFWNIHVTKNSGNLSLNDPIEIENNVDYTTGIVISSQTALMIYRDNATFTNCSNLSHTNGPVRKIGDEAFTFPVGNGNYYRLAAISSPANITDHFTCQYFLINPNTSGYNTLLKDVTLIDISQCEYWILDRTGGVSNVTVTLSWNSSTSCAINNLSDLKVARWNGTIWKDHGNGGTTGNAATGTINSISSVTSFSPFTIDSGPGIPLPIELIKFEVSCNSESIIFNWSTLSELNNDYFVIEYSRDGIKFEEISTHDGAGNSNILINYEEILLNDLYEESYYRLRQVDFNGESSYSDVKIIDCNTNKIIIYPNPSDGLISVKGVDKNVLIEIFDGRGSMIYQSYLSSSNSVFDLRAFASGVYTLKVSEMGNIVFKRFVLN